MQTLKWITSMSLVLFLILPILSLHTWADEAWDKGGNLQSASVYRWMKSSAANRLATSADWFLRMTRQSNQPLWEELKAMDRTDYEKSYRHYATRLESCISEKAGKKSVRPENRVMDYVEKCYQTLHGTDRSSAE